MKKYLQAFSVLFATATLSVNVSAQGFMGPNPAKNWQNQSIEQDSVYGTGSDKALEMLKGRKPVTVIVAVEDGGTYIKHPGLKANIWVNPKEIAGNKKDDDKNGYIDDVNGWDYIGGKDSDINKENLEVTRLYRDLGKKYSGIDLRTDTVDKEGMLGYRKYLKVKKDFEARLATTTAQYNNLKGVFDSIGLIKKAMGKSDFNRADLDSLYKPTDSAMIRAKARLMRNFKRFSFFMKGATADSLIKLLKPSLDHISVTLNYQLNVNFNPRYLVGDNYEDASQRNYGNNDVAGPAADHGTHVAGIIAGFRTGKAGEQEGIADNVKIMVVRVVPDGDERDKDVANGIRYAVDNGAKIINMSFGKAYAYNKKAVDEAVKYAEDHDVLLVHAAGNDHSDNDTVIDYPNRRYEGTNKEASNWLEVGASDVNGRPGSFSNYGKQSVDLFAPGVKIYSTIPDSGYAYFNGTSMASPCAAGVAAIIREYFPKLSAKEVREILMQSVTKPDFKVVVPGQNDDMVSYADLCISGGIINTQKAVKLAIEQEKVDNGKMHREEF